MLKIYCQVMVDVSHFLPNEISVKTTDKNIIVHGKLTNGKTCKSIPSF